MSSKRARKTGEIVARLRSMLTSLMPRFSGASAVLGNVAASGSSSDSAAIDSATLAVADNSSDIASNSAAETVDFPTWEHILGIDEEGRAEREAEHREKRHSSFFGILAVLLIAGSVLVVGTPFAMRALERSQVDNVSSQTAKTVAGWPYQKVKAALAAARAYNQRLAKTSQSVIGEARDPLEAPDADGAGAGSSGGAGRSGNANSDASGSAPSSASSNANSSGDDSLAAQDKEYQSLLDVGEGVIGTVRVPKISVNLPIYHGTSDDVLARGIGHLYGTSLPVGGKNTHVVLTGHRGLMNAELFTRLDELRKGDVMYLDVMGETLGYKVDRISVIKPNEVDKLKVVPGEDRLTLMTCTPYGVNTHRLLVSGVRVAIPHAKAASDGAKDARAMAVRVAIGVGCSVLGMWLWLGLLNPRRDQWMLIQHAASRPDWV